MLKDRIRIQNIWIGIWKKKTELRALMEYKLNLRYGDKKPKVILVYNRRLLFQNKDVIVLL